MYQAPTFAITYPCGVTNVILPGVQSFTSTDDYKQQTGVDAPKFNPANPVKLWRDTMISRAMPDGLTNPNRGRRYWVIARDTITGPSGIPVAGVPTLEEAHVPGWWAITVNIPGPSEGSGNINVQLQEFMFPVIENKDGSCALTNYQIEVDQSPFGIVVVGPQ
jgi:hypothetical protein